MNSTQLELTFENIREYALWDVWALETNRELVTSDDPKYVNLIRDIYWHSFECVWQNKAGDLKTDVNWHVPHFCSLGDWAGNITDLLTDIRYDRLSFTVPIDQEFLFRYYVRVLLIASEILADFEVILRDANLVEGSHTVKNRRKALSGRVDVEQLMQYINAVCKHKSSQGLHLHNHHLKYWFEDSNIACPFTNPISPAKTDFQGYDKPDGIVVPELAKIIMALTDGYAKLDELFERNPEEFAAFCIRVGDEYEDEEDVADLF